MENVNAKQSNTKCDDDENEAEIDEKEKYEREQNKPHSFYEHLFSCFCSLKCFANGESKKKIENYGKSTN